MMGPHPKAKDVLEALDMPQTPGRLRRIQRNMQLQRLDPLLAAQAANGQIGVRTAIRSAQKQIRSKRPMGHSGHMTPVAFQLTDETEAILDGICQRSQMSREEVVRALLSPDLVRL